MGWGGQRARILGSKPPQGLGRARQARASGLEGQGSLALTPRTAVHGQSPSLLLETGPVGVSALGPLSPLF